jgi:hypothetical protein
LLPIDLGGTTFPSLNVALSVHCPLSSLQLSALALALPEKMFFVRVRTDPIYRSTSLNFLRWRPLWGVLKMYFTDYSQLKDVVDEEIEVAGQRRLSAPGKEDCTLCRGVLGTISHKGGKVMAADSVSRALLRMHGYRTSSRDRWNQPTAILCRRQKRFAPLSGHCRRKGGQSF